VPSRGATSGTLSGMSDKCLAYERRGAIAIVTIDDAPHNRMSLAFMDSSVTVWEADWSSHSPATSVSLRWRARVSVCRNCTLAPSRPGAAARGWRGASAAIEQSI
jgi:hypothetical protein